MDCVKFSIGFLALAAMGCMNRSYHSGSESGVEQVMGATLHGIAESSDEGIAILRFLNDAGSTAEVLQSAGLSAPLAARIRDRRHVTQGRLTFRDLQRDMNGLFGADDMKKLRDAVAANGVLAKVMAERNPPPTVTPVGTGTETGTAQSPVNGPIGADKPGLPPAMRAFINGEAFPFEMKLSVYPIHPTGGHEDFLKKTCVADVRGRMRLDPLTNIAGVGMGRSARLDRVLVHCPGYLGQLGFNSEAMTHLCYPDYAKKRVICMRPCIERSVMDTAFVIDFSSGQGEFVSFRLFGMYYDGMHTVHQFIAGYPERPIHEITAGQCLRTREDFAGRW